jgi:hypothetical protein
MYTQKSPRGLVLIALLIAAVALVAGCSSSSKKDNTPAGSSISLTASPTTVNTGNTSIVEVTINNGGVGVADQEVTFSVSPSSAGFFTPAKDTTDANGTAATVFTATTAGAADITADVTGSTLTRSVGLSIQQGQQGTGSGNVNMTVTPSLIRANGVDSATVRVTVRDALGQAAPESTAVKLTAGEKFVDRDGNGYWSNGVDSIVYDANANGSWDGLGLIASAAYTDAAGVVTVKYYSGNDALTVYIKATVDDKGITGYAEVPLQLTPDATVNSIYLASDSMNLSVKQTGGIESGTIRAIAYDINGNEVPEGLPINFIITDGPGGGEHLANVGYGPYQAVTNNQGVATVSIHSGMRSGTVRIRAYADTVLSNATQVLISAGPPEHIVIGADTCNVPFWNVVNGRNKIVAVVSDVYLNPVNDSTVVYFSCDEGSMKSHEKRTQDHEGVATTEWISGNNVDTADGLVKIMCETSGGTVADTGYFINSGPTWTVLASSFPSSVTASDEAKFTITVNGLDYNGLYPINGTIVNSDAKFLKTASTVLADGCGSAWGTIEMKSVALDVDYSTTGGNDDGIGAVDTVVLRSGYAVQAYPINLTTGFTSRTGSAVQTPSACDTGKTIDISVAIVDRWNNPLGDHTLNMTATSGTVLSATHETDAYGEAFGFRWRAPLTAGVQTIYITDTDPRGGGVVLSANITVNAP